MILKIEVVRYWVMVDFKEGERGGRREGCFVWTRR